MQKYYLKSLQKMKELNRTVTREEWNKIAKEEGDLSTESLKYISGMEFEELCENVVKKSLNIA